MVSSQQASELRAPAADASADNTQMDGADPVADVADEQLQADIARLQECSNGDGVLDAIIKARQEELDRRRAARLAGRPAWQVQRDLSAKLERKRKARAKSAASRTDVASQIESLRTELAKLDEEATELDTAIAGIQAELAACEVRPPEASPFTAWADKVSGEGIPDHIRDAVRAVQEAVRVVEVWRTEAASACSGEAESAAADAELRASLAEAGADARAKRPRRGEAGEEESVHEASEASQSLSEANAEQSEARPYVPPPRSNAPASARGYTPYG